MEELNTLQPVGFADVAQQIYNATRIISDANNIRVGEPVHVDIISGLSPQVNVLSSLGGTITGPQGGPLSGPLSTLLNTTVTKVNFKIKYSVKVNGNPARNGDDFNTTPSLNNLPDQSDPLSIAFLFKPSVSDNTIYKEPLHYEINVFMTVQVDGLTVTNDPNEPTPLILLPPITIPVDIPHLQIPALLIMSKHTRFRVRGGPNNDDPGSFYVMVRTASPMRELDTIVDAWNSLMGVISKLENLMHWGNIITGISSKIVDWIASAPTVYFGIGNISDLKEFDDAASAFLLIGAFDLDPQKNTAVTFYKDTNFEMGSGDEERSTFSVNEIITHLGTTSIHTGIGVIAIPDFTIVDWQTDPGDNMNDSVSSVRFGVDP